MRLVLVPLVGLIALAGCDAAEPAPPVDAASLRIHQAIDNDAGCSAGDVWCATDLTLEGGRFSYRESVRTGLRWEATERTVEGALTDDEWARIVAAVDADALGRLEQEGVECGTGMHQLSVEYGTAAFGVWMAGNAYDERIEGWNGRAVRRLRPLIEGVQRIRSRVQAGR